MNRRRDDLRDSPRDRRDIERVDYRDDEFNDALRAGESVRRVAMRRPENIRPESVDVGIQFWVDERMSQKTPREKEAFLRDKGLSHEEIREVRRRAEEEMLLRQPPPSMSNSNNISSGIGRATIQGQQVQYIPIPIPSHQGPQIAPPTFFSRVMGILQTITMAAGMLVAGNFAYQHYVGQQNGNPMLTWGGGAENNNRHQKYHGQQQQGPQQQFQNQELTHRINDSDQSRNELENLGDQNMLAGPSRHDPSMQVMKESLRDMQERMELQNTQLREAVKQLQEIASAQSTQAANHTSMGLLLANTAAGATAQERSIRDELSQIKDMIRDRLGSPNNAKEPSSSTTTSSSSNSSTSLSMNATNATLTSNNGEKKEEEREEKTQEDKDAEREEKLQADLQERKSKIDEAVASVKNNNESTQLNAAFNMLEMVLKNLFQNPDVPRYRKIPMTNKNMKKNLGEVDGHEDLLKACGFVKNGKNFEWSLLPKSHEVQDEDMVWARKLHDAVLKHARATIKQLLTVKPAIVTPSTPVAAPTSTSPITTPIATPVEPIVTPTSSPATNSNVVATDDSNKTVITSTTSATSATTGVPPVSITTATNKTISLPTTSSSDDTITLEPLTNNTTNQASTKISTDDTPEFPLAFKEVIKMVNEGKEMDLPGIRKIPEQVSSDAQNFLGITSIHRADSAVSRDVISSTLEVTEPIKKPWETEQPDIVVLNNE